MPRERTELPHVVYRLTEPPPFWCEFPSMRYWIAMVPCLPAKRYELTAYHKPRAWEIILATCHTPERLQVVIFTEGFPVRVDTLAATIMRKLVRDGRADVLGNVVWRWGQPLE